jgi:hypothetical protein
MFKETCLIALKRIDQSSHIFHLQSLRILDLEIFVRLILEFFIRRPRNDSPNSQAYNHTNATIIRI